MNSEVFLHILRGGDSRNTMIRKIIEQLNGDTDVLADDWENLPINDLFELYSNLVEAT